MMSWTDIVERNVGQYGDLVAGIDPSLSDIPSFFERDADEHWIGTYVNFLLDVLEGQVGFVKFQSAYFEACGLAGLKALSLAMVRAKSAGIGVILDAKRGDIGVTATAYARAYLIPSAAGGGGDFEADCLTVNPLMGPDTLQPFVECANEYGKGLFILCRTSNPGAAWLQDKIAGNRLVSDRLADLIGSMAIGAGTADGLSNIGAVVGATVPEEGRRLRQYLPRSIILAPGLGAQGGDVASIHALRGARAGDLLVPVSRGLTRVDHREMSPQAYRELILTRLSEFRQALVYTYPHRDKQRVSSGVSQALSEPDRL
ncbi:orotidine-5'-phosphate decarboxylase [Agrobacterium vitis]|nr:orotidine-5'-phosphate decarboxylase [Agrobacterium vitis]MBE1440566.1 orotidine-5'-phosphate decarboxylase [Agrobacterium vitis]